MTPKMRLAFLFYSFFQFTLLYSDIIGQGKIEFKTDNQSGVQLTLNSNGLGVGVVPSSNLHVNGSLAYGYQMISSNTLLSGNSYLLVDTSSDNISITLPFAGNVDGRIYKIKKTSANYYLTVNDEDVENFEEHIFSPTAVEDDLPYAEFFSASGNWHLLAHSGVSEKWQPSASSNISVWLDATDEDSISSSSDNVSQWNDKSGNDYHVTQANAGVHPKTGTRTINGLNGIDFDGTNDRIEYSSNFFTSDQSYTKVLIYFIDTTSKTNNTITLGNSALYNELFIYHAGNQVSSSSYPGAGIPMIAIATYESGSQADLYIDGVNVGSNSGPGAWANSGNYFQLGSHGAGNNLDGVMGEVMLFNHAASDDLRQKIEGYLARKWGLLDNLAADHPYKNTPPAK